MYGHWRAPNPPGGSCGETWASQGLWPLLPMGLAGVSCGVLLKSCRDPSGSPSHGPHSPSSIVFDLAYGSGSGCHVCTWVCTVCIFCLLETPEKPAIFWEHLLLEAFLPGPWPSGEGGFPMPTVRQGTGTISSPPGPTLEPVFSRWMHFPAEARSLWQAVSDLGEVVFLLGEKGLEGVPGMESWFLDC